MRVNENPTSVVPISFNHEEGQRTFSNEICLNIFKYFSARELSKLCCVSKHWLELSTCNPLWKAVLDKVKSSVVALLNHPSTPDLFFFNSNAIFQFYLPEIHKDESIHQCVTKNIVQVQGEDLTDSFESLLNTCELGIPKLRVYKSLKDSFTVALAILVGTPQKNECVQAEISFINSFDPGRSNWDENEPPHFPQMQGCSTRLKNQGLYYKTWFWYAPQSFLLSDFFITFHEKIFEMCAKRIDTLTSSR